MAGWRCVIAAVNVPGLSDQLWAVSILEIDGERVLHRFARLAPAPSLEAMYGARSACFVTDIPWRPSFAKARPDCVFGSTTIMIEM